MPMGPAPLGFSAFVAVKLVGYTAGAKLLQRAYNTPQVGAYKVGSARTVLGLVAGLAYGGVWWVATRNVTGAGPSLFWYFLGLVPVRLGEWSLILWIFFDRGSANGTKRLALASLGSLWSYALDALGIGAALVIPGGMWVC